MRASSSDMTWRSNLYVGNSPSFTGEAPPAIALNKSVWINTTATISGNLKNVIVFERVESSFEYINGFDLS